MKIFEKISDFLNEVTKMLGIMCLLGMVVIIMINAILRYAFNISLIWAYDVLRILMVGLVFFCTCLVYYKKEHIRFVIVYEMYGDGFRKIFNILVYLASIILFAVLGAKGMELSTSLWSTKLASSGISNFWLYIFFALSMFVLIVHAVRFIIEEIRGGKPES